MAKRFKFRLETLLKLKEEEEREARDKFLYQKNYLESLHISKARLEKEINELSQFSPPTLIERENLARYLQLLRSKIEDLETKILNASKVLEELREKLMEKKKEKEILEKLKEKQEKGHLMLLSKEEQKALDEISSNMWFREEDKK